MAKINNVIFWQGRPLTELTKEELIEVIEFCGLEIKRLEENINRWRRNGDVRKYLMDVNKDKNL